ncbi:SGNH/GDSL hydrolase family protein [Bradyrhizobium sp.]|uniref:SGNH/GDSL hydrolase family protein n=1 Tax=Bradyrhizobium sp. TaxID=376 RepID=UPI002606168B|nr:SGNH/GDSL hydrolase family protein [Bradyrhizobium sp.]
MKANAKSAALVSLAIGAGLAGWSYFRKPVHVDAHRHTRQIILHYTLSRVEQPIIVLGDSITEASTLPRTLCDHAIVNAGLDGASTASDLGTWLRETLNGRRAAAIMIALGTNDALQGREQKEFEANYGSLLAQLKDATDHLAVLGIPSIEVRGRMPPDYQAETMKRIDAFNAMLPALANKGGAAFAALPPMPAPHTIDGVHLDAAGYAVWDAAVLKGVSGACSKP